MSYVSSDTAATFKVEGIKSTAGITVDSAKKTVTIMVANLNKETVTIDDGYSLKLASDVAAPQKESSASRSAVKNTKATYNAAG